MEHIQLETHDEEYKNTKTLTFTIKTSTQTTKLIKKNKPHIKIRKNWTHLEHLIIFHLIRQSHARSARNQCLRYCFYTIPHRTIELPLATSRQTNSTHETQFPIPDDQNLVKYPKSCEDQAMRMDHLRQVVRVVRGCRSLESWPN